MRRSKKLALLAGLMNGQVDKSALFQLKRLSEGCLMVVSDEGEPAATDLVDTRLADEQGRTRVPYADFLNNPDIYGRYCVVVN